MTDEPTDLTDLRAQLDTLRRENAQQAITIDRLMWERDRAQEEALSLEALYHQMRIKLNQGIQNVNQWIERCANAKKWARAWKAAAKGHRAGRSRVATRYTGRMDQFIADLTLNGDLHQVSYQVPDIPETDASVVVRKVSKRIGLLRRLGILAGESTEALTCGSCGARAWWDDDGAFHCEHKTGCEWNDSEQEGSENEPRS